MPVSYCFLFAILSELLLEHSITKLYFVFLQGISYGTFAVRLTLFTDPTFETEMNSLSARLSPGSEMYFEVSMEAPNVSMAMYLEFCYGKPFFSSDKDERFIFIKNK